MQCRKDDCLQIRFGLAGISILLMNEHNILGLCPYTHSERVFPSMHFEKKKSTKQRLLLRDLLMELIAFCHNKKSKLLLHKHLASLLSDLSQKSY